jgi:uncharacterized membrane protein YhfC
LEDIVFSDALMASLYVIFIVCIFVPVFYYIWFAIKKKINHVAILCGLAVFFVFEYYLSGGILKLIEGSEGMGAWGAAALRTLTVAAAETAGIWLGLKLMSRTHSSVRVPTGFALGFRLFDLLYLGAFNSLLRLANAVLTRARGKEYILQSVDEEYVPQMEQLLRSLADTKPYVFIMSAVDYACMFILSAAVVRIIWYSIEGGRRPPDVRLAGAAFLFRAAAELPMALYQSGGGGYALCAAAYYLMTALTAAFAVVLSRSRDEREKPRAERLRPRTRGKRQ